MVTRNINNNGSPLTNPKGVLLSNTSISFVIVNRSGKRIDVFDAETHERVSGLVTITTDSNGEFSVNLFPTTRADKECYYLVHVHNNAFLDFKSALQEGNTPISWFSFKHCGISITPYYYSLIQYFLDNFYDDTVTSDILTWSSNKISSEIASVNETISNLVIDLSDKAGIDDENISQTTTYSSSKIEDITQFVHVQSTASSEWTINHTLGRYPTVSILDSTNRVVYGDIEHITVSQVKISFGDNSFAGMAILN